jgi:hypothetical protein
VLVRLDPVTGRAYEHAVAPIGRWAERRLGPGVLANRLDPRAPATVRPWRTARARWDELVRRPQSRLLVRADVVDCYGAIGERALRRALGDRADALIEVLRPMWDAGVRGLPIGPDPSAIVANAVLATVDEAVASAGGTPLRWVDDWAVPVPDPRRAGAVLVSIERALDRIGLELHAGKSGIVSARPTGVGGAPSGPVR